MALRTLTNAASADVIAALQRQGAVVVRSLASEASIKAIEQEVSPYLAQTPQGEGVFVGRKTRRTSGLIRKSPTSAELAMNSVVLEVMDAFLLPNCDRYQLHVTQAISIDPGERAQILHRDEAMYVHLPCLEGECMLNVMWPLTEYTNENGATRVIPNSHEWDGPAETANQSLAAAAEMRPGDALFYLGSVIHGAGANNSHAPRTGIVMGYSLAWLRQYENQYLSVPPHVAEKLPIDLQALLGYAAHRPNLGTYETQDPIDALRAGLPDVMPAKDLLRPEELQILEAMETSQ